MPLTFYSVYANTSNDNDIVFHHSSRLTASVVLLKLNLKFYFTKTSEAEKPFRSVFVKLVCPGHQAKISVNFLPLVSLIIFSIPEKNVVLTNDFTYIKYSFFYSNHYSIRSH